MHTLNDFSAGMVAESFAAVAAVDVDQVGLAVPAAVLRGGAVAPVYHGRVRIMTLIRLGLLDPLRRPPPDGGKQM